jgi:5-methylcytosine-specific restriction endonuclease McrA
MPLSKFAMFCIETGRSELVAKEVAKFQNKKRFQKSWRYSHPKRPLENIVNDKRRYYRSEYLKSDHWKQLRANKLSITPYCEKCGVRRRLDVHHLNYRNLYDVSVSDLMTLCRRCHEAEHRCQ